MPAPGASLTEFRTPLSGLIGMVDLLLESDLNQQQREFVNAARRSAENLFVIVNSLLNLATVSALRKEQGEVLSPVSPISSSPVSPISSRER